MNIQKTYSAGEFANKVGEKTANIGAFRIFARELGLIQNHEPLTQEFLPAWDIAQKLHYEKGVKWENAMKHGLTEVFQNSEKMNSPESKTVTANSIEEKLDEVIIQLRRIAAALER